VGSSTGSILYYSETKNWLNGSSFPVYGTPGDYSRADLDYADTYTRYAYDFYEAEVQKQVKLINRDAPQGVDSDFFYDGLGRLSYVNVGGPRAHTLEYTNDINGQVLARRVSEVASGVPGTGTPTQFYHYYNGIMIGSNGTNGNDRPDMAAAIAERGAVSPTNPGREGDIPYWPACCLLWRDSRLRRVQSSYSFRIFMQNRLIDQILNMPRIRKRIIALSVDTLICLTTVAIAYWIRLGEWIAPVGTQWLSYAAALLAIPLFITSGLYRAIFRYAGWGALIGVVRASALFGIVYCIVFAAIGIPGIPRTIGVLQPILLFLAIGCSRAIARYWLGGGYQQLLRLGQRRRVLIYGAGSAGRQLAAALANSEEMQVVAFIDDDPTLQGSVLNGKQIYGPDDLSQRIDDLEVADLLLAIPSASRQRRNEIIDSLASNQVSVRTLPGVADLAHGKVTVNDLRELDIDDLLGRDAVAPNQLLLAKNIADKTVLVTGAGGSIGSELCRQILALRPTALVLVEQGEYNLYAIEQDLLARRAGVAMLIAPLLASVQDEKRIDQILCEWKPDTIYHAAAYKHVPLVEHNPAEGVRNNVLGTFNVAQLAEKHGVSDFVLISTDKAVRPTNVMGATKRLAEMVLQAMAAESGNTRFSMVRFGNVLGSSGSVVPLFRKQIKEGGPVTVTHDQVTRYFMTIPEAAQLVIQAGAMAKGGEVFVLDMGSPVRIVDLAARMIELSGLTVRDEANPEGDIEIRVTGLRPGEKLFEELLIGDNPEDTAHPLIMKAHDGFLPLSSLKSKLSKLEGATIARNNQELRRLLKEIVPEFSGDDTDVEISGLPLQMSR
jgi:FlaA1/EpsC-like NDP-sugar epimerase